MAASTHASFLRAQAEKQASRDSSISDPWHAQRQRSTASGVARRPHAATISCLRTALYAEPTRRPSSAVFPASSRFADAMAVVIGHWRAGLLEIVSDGLDRRKFTPDWCL